MGSDCSTLGTKPATSQFQSTLPVWGATKRFFCRGIQSNNFNPRSPYGERPLVSCPVSKKLYFNPRSPYGERLAIFSGHLIRHFISIHAPRMGSDPNALPTFRARLNFNPRSPYGERQQKYPKIFLKNIWLSLYYTKAKMIDSIYFRLLLKYLIVFPQNPVRTSLKNHERFSFAPL